MSIGKMYTPREAAAETGFHVLKILRLIKAGKLPAKNVSAGEKQARWVIRESDLAGFFEPTPVTKSAARSRPKKRRALDAGVERHFQYDD